MLILSPIYRSKNYQKRNRALDIRRSSRNSVSVEGISELEWRKRDEQTGMVGAADEERHVTTRLAEAQQDPTEGPWRLHRLASRSPLISLDYL
jgi:hypothetical protein